MPTIKGTKKYSDLRYTEHKAKATTMMEASPRTDVAIGDDEPQDWKLDEVNMEAQQAHSSHHSMPTPEELIADPGFIRSPSKRLPKKLVIVIVVAIVVAIVAIPVAMIGANGSKTSEAVSSGKPSEDTIDKVDVDSTAKDADGDIDHTDSGKQGESLNEQDADNDGSTNNQGTTDASTNGAEQRKTTMEEIVDWMANEDVSHRTNMETVGQPQYHAVEWLAVYDPANLPLPATGREDFGDGYRYVVRYVMAVNYFALVGNLWPQKFNFMSDLDVCEWNVRILIMRGVLMPLSERFVSDANVVLYLSILTGHESVERRLVLPAGTIGRAPLRSSYA